MFDFIRKHTRVLFFFLIVLIIPSFVFFGLQGYTDMDGGSAGVVAEVGDTKITQAEWDNAHREQIERIRAQSPGIDMRMLDTPELRSETLEGLIRDRLLLLAADKLHLVTTDERMLRIFREDPQFEFLRRPDGTVNADILAAQGMSSEVFAQRLRRDMSVRQVIEGVQKSAIAPNAAASAAFDAYLQQRDVQVVRFEPESYGDRIKPTDAEIEAFYKDPANAQRFQAPEQVDIEYVVLDATKLQDSINIDPGEMRKYYQQNEARYGTPEERRASHILVKADKSASADERAKAKAKAEALLAEVRKNPQSFADVARKNSDDPGSAANGGDLDFFAKGAMVKPFEEAAFSLQKNAISDIVESDFGYHIIQVTDARGGQKRSFEDVRPEIEALLRKQLAQQKYSELAADFSNVVYEQSDSLKPAADKFKLEVQSAKGLTRNPAPDAAGPLASPKLREAVFSSEAVTNKRNTDAIEAAPTQMVAARVTRHAPAQVRPLAEVRAQVVDSLIAQQASALARKEGEARLAELKTNPGKGIETAPVTISRARSNELPQKVVDAALRAPAGSLPTVVGVDLGAQGYAIVQVNKVLGRDPLADDAALKREYARAVSDAQTHAYFEALKRRFGVERKTTAAPASAE
jgi:peptidyl-prolyl cis-trans isomerase D